MQTGQDGSLLHFSHITKTMSPPSLSNTNNSTSSSIVETSEETKNTPVVTHADELKISGERMSASTLGSKPIPSSADEALPWYRTGGMKMNAIGMGINIVATLFILSKTCLNEQQVHYFLSFLVLSYLSSFLIGMRTMYCIVVFPTYMTSLFLSLALEGGQSSTFYQSPILILVVALSVAIYKVNICMSVCLHRYAAHSAFKCGFKTHIFLSILGTLANQGGPIWWSSQHRCHHKYCDMPRDPHSPLLDGAENAFTFFQTHDEVNEEFTPKHLWPHTILMRLIDTWSCIFVSIEFLLSYLYFGNTGLFITFTSAWLCQSITLWFNIINHPPSANGKDKKDDDKICKASDDASFRFEFFYLPIIILDFFVPLFAVLANESKHDHHHRYARLAKRSTFDVSYWGFIWPLEKLGLIWNVIVKE